VASTDRTMDEILSARTPRICPHHCVGCELSALPHLHITEKRWSSVPGTHVSTAPHHKRLRVLIPQLPPRLRLRLRTTSTHA
jgi:hypothetical protein